MLQQGNGIKIIVNDCSIVYDDQGIGNNPLLFIHAFPLTRSMWSNQSAAFAASNRFIALDLRGFGESTAGTEQLSISLFADDLIAFMDRLEISRATIAGLSMGGYVCLNAVQRFPERFNGLILCNTQCIADTDEVRNSRYRNIELISNGKTEIFAKAMAGKMLSQVAKQNGKLTKYVEDTILQQQPDILCQALEALARRWETCSGLRNIHVPTLILCGADDEITPVDRHKFLHKHINSSDFVIIQNAGHLTALERPEEFNKAVIAYMEKVNSFSL